MRLALALILVAACGGPRVQCQCDPDTGTVRIYAGPPEFHDRCVTWCSSALLRFAPDGAAKTPT